jgi:hypothetical protein
MRLLIIILFCGLYTFLGAQSTYFNMKYKYDKGINGTFEIVTNGNQLYFDMSTLDIQNNRYEFNLRVVDSLGETILYGDTLSSFQKHYYSGGLIKTTTQKLVDVMTLQGSNGNQSFGVVGFDLNGSVLFKTESSDTFLFITMKQIAETIDSGYVLFGTTQTIPANQSGTEDMILIKTDSLGNEQWRKIYGNTTNFEQGHSVAITPDGGYILGGIRQVPGGSLWLAERPYVIKTDSLGNVEWEQVYGAADTANLPAYSIITTQDGGYAFVGGLGIERFTSISTKFPWLVKLDNQGNELWSKVNKEGVPVRIFSEYTDLVELPDGSLVVCGTHYRPNLDTVNFKNKYSTMGVIAKYAANGDSIWSRSFVHPENLQSPWSDHFFNSITQTDDGGFAAAGYLLPNPPDTGTQDTWVVKVDSFGCLVQGCEVVSVPQIETSIASLRIYPNPTNGILNIEITPNGNQHQFNFELYDILGKRVHTQKLIPYTNTLSVSGLTSGIYTYKIDEVWGKIVVE